MFLFYLAQCSNPSIVRYRLTASKTEQLLGTKKARARRLIGSRVVGRLLGNYRSETGWQVGAYRL